MGDITIHGGVIEAHGGKVSGSVSDAPSDGRFTHRPNYQKRYWKPSYFDAVTQLQAACAAHGLTLIEASYRWLMNHSSCWSTSSPLAVGTSDFFSLTT